MTFWDPVRIRAILNASWLARTSRADIAGVSTDSRAIQPGQVFFALRGDNFDAHDYLAAAAEAGSPLLVIDDLEALEHQNVPDDVGVLKVPDTLDALTHLAAAYRRTLDGARVVAVTGSNGKTTTVRLIDAVLGSRLRGTASIKSYNNLIGVSLTILAAKPSDQYLVCEVGMNAPGEIAPLARIIDPDIAVVTNIGRAHIEAFGDREGIAREKAVLLSYLRPNGLAVAPANEPLLADFLRPVPNVLLYGTDEDANLRITNLRQHPDNTLSFVLNDRADFTIPLIGRHNALNAVAAIGVARRFGLSDADVATGLARADPAEMRLTRSTVAGIDVFNDAYNASPESMTAAIDTFAELTTGATRRVVVLGDMLELGDAATSAHEEIAQHLLERFTPDLLVAVGAHALVIAERVSRDIPPDRVVILSQLDADAPKRVAARIRKGDAVLIKGSRRIGLERIADAIRLNDASKTTVA